jgi:predicted lipoprotein with Yx(FWY)xxD motif
MRNPRKLLLLSSAALVAVAGLAFAACGDDDNTKTAAASPTTATNVQPTSAPTSAATTAPTSAPTAATAAATIKTGTGGALGTVLTDAAGFTLYTFKNDVNGSGKSVCNGSCASTWPAVVATGAPVAGTGISGAVSAITRDDGTKQVAYKGQPLYRFAPDKAPGDTNGQGIGNVWFVATP